MTNEVKVTCKTRGTGGELIYTGDSKDAVREASELGKKMMDPYRDPACTLPYQLKDGRWQASVSYFGLD